MFRKASCLLSSLKALIASTSSTPPFSESSKTDVRAEAADSQDARCPAHCWYVPAASSSSDEIVQSMLLEMILRATSPLPIGLTPGFLSKTSRRDAVKACTS